MAVNKIGYNLSAIKDINISLDIPTKSTDIINSAISVANSSSNNYLGLLIGFGFSIISYLALADRSQYSNLRYSDSKSMAITFGFSTFLLISLMDMNIIQDLKSVLIFGVLFTISYIYTIYYQT